MNLLKMNKPVIALVLLALTSVSASASSLVGVENFGSYIGTFNGIDSEEWFDTQLGLTLDHIETLTAPSISEGDLSIFDLTLNGSNEVIGGQWVYTGPETITHLVLSYGAVFSVYEFTDGTNTGYFNTSAVLNKPFEVLSVYAAPVPLPAAVWLLMSGCLGLIGFGKRRST